MKAIILCGGQGTRLREMTEIRPKPMVVVGGRPILWHIMKFYAHHGVREFILCLGYKGNVIKEYFLNYEMMNSDFTLELGKSKPVELHGEAHGEDGWRITFVETGEKSNTGARVKRASRYLGNTRETFCVTYGDGVTNLDLRAALEFHRRHGKLATLTGVRPPGRFGELRQEKGRVIQFEEKPQMTEGLINGGFLFLEPEFLRYLTDEPACSLEGEPLKRAAADGQLYVFEHPDYWQCMDTYRDWDSLERQWQAGSAPWKVWK
jgi:glucose-1-phosphate cytidylyltransferase